MSNDNIGRAVIEVTADASGVEAGMSDINRSVQQTAKVVDQASTKTGASLGKIGTSAEGASQKLDTSTRNMIYAIQRATAAAEAGSRSTAEYFRTIAGQRNISLDTLKPYLAQLDAANERQVRAGLSAGELKNALRSLPAQFTDIATSLASGQQPITVLLQQGGQLKDMFGGIGGAARAMGAYVASLVGPFSVAALAAGGLTYAFHAGGKEFGAYVKALSQTNGAVGLSAMSLADMAKEVSAISGTTAKAAEVLAAFAQSGDIAGANMRKFASVAIEAEKIIGTSVDEIAKDFSALGDEPLKASLKLDESVRFLTISLYEQIKALEEQGKSAAAADVAQNAYADTLARRTAEMQGNLGLIERAWNGITGAIKAAGSAMLEVGRKSTIAETLAEKRTELARLSAGGTGVGSRFGLATADADKRRQQLQLEIAGYESDLRRLQTDAARDAERETVRKAGLRAVQSVDALLDQLSSRGEKYKKALKKLRDDVAAANRAARMEGGSEVYSKAEVARMEAALADQYRDKTRKTRSPSDRKANAYGSREDRDVADLRARLAAESQLTALMEKNGAAYEKLTEGEKLATKYRMEADVARTKSASSHLRALAVMADELGAQQALNQAMKDRIAVEKAFKAAAAERAEDMRLAEEDSARQLQLMTLTGQERAVAAAQWEAEKQTKRELYVLNAQLSEAIEAQTAAQERLNEAMQQGDATAIAAYKKLLAQRSAIVEQIQSAQAGVQSDGEVKRQNAGTKAAADYAAQEWQRTSDSIRDSLTDALMRGFESGKDFARNFRDTLKNMFETLILRPVVQAIVSPVSSGIASLLGVSQSASAADGPGLGNLSTLSSLANMFGGNSIGQGIGNFAASGISWLGGGTGGAVTSTLGTIATNAPMYANWQFGAAGLGGGIAGNYIGKQFGGRKSGQYGSIGGGLGATVGMSVGGPIGAAIGAVIGSVAGGIIGKGGGAKVGGNYNAVFDAQGTVAENMFGGYTPSQADAQLKETLTTFNTQYRELAKLLGGSGKTITANLGFDTDPKGTAGSRVSAQLAVGAVGVGMGTTESERELWRKSAFSWVSKGVGDAQQGVSEAVTRMMVAALQQSDLQKEYADVLNSIDVNTAPIDQLNAKLAELKNLQAVNAVFDDLSKVFPQLASTTLAARKAIIDFAGGLDALGAGMSSYYENYFSDEEKRAKVLADVNAALSKVNLTAPSTRAEFRRMVESLDLSSEAGQKAYAALMSVSGAFASVTDAMQTQQSAAERMSALTDRVQQAYDRESQQKEQLIERLTRYADSLKDLRNSLNLGGLSTLSPEEKYKEAKRLFDETSAKAIGGDADAQEKLGSIAQQYLEASRAYNASTAAYAADYAKVQAVLVSAEASARAQITIEQQQLDSMKAMVKGILDLNKGVESLAEALRAYYAGKSGGGSIGAGGGGAGNIIYDSKTGTINGVGFGKLGMEVPSSMVDRAYRNILGRTVQPGDSGADYWESLLESGKYGKGDIDTDQFIRDFIASAQGADKTAAQKWLESNPTYAPANSGGSSSQTAPSPSVSSVVDAVSKAYQDALGRQADRAGLDWYTQQIASGAKTLADALREIKDSAEAKARVDGSHAAGLERVPFDGYVAELHEGERVLTAAEARQYNASRVDFGRYGREVALIEEVRALRTEVARLRAENREDAAIDRQQRGAIAQATLKQGDAQARLLVRQAASNL